MFYIPLYVKTENSLLSSMIKIKDLVKTSKELGYKAITITDNNMFGAYEFYLECINNDIKPIIGLELEINECKFILYCKNYNGYKNLIKLSTINNEKKIEIDDLNLYSNDLICITPFTSRLIYKELNKIYDFIYIGYKNKDELAHLKGNNLVYMNEILYLNIEDSNYYRYLIGIKESKTIEEIEINSENYLKKIDEIDKNYPETLTNYNIIYNMCDLVIEKENNLLPVFDCPNEYTSDEYLKILSISGLKKRFGESVSKGYIKRLKYELEVIKTMDFSNYFLVVMDYVKYAKDNNILVGPGRGSAAGSLVSYCLEITDIDPIKYNLLFERFLNPMRITMPDIDIDFEYNRREEVINYCLNKYGMKKVAGIITFGTLSSKQAIRDVGKVMNLNNSLIDSVCKLIDSKLTLKDNLEKNTKLKEIIEKNKEVKKLYQVSIKIEGIKRHTSVHAAGIVISSSNLDEIVPLYKHNNMYLTGYTMNYLEDLGLLKMDFLGLKNLNIISNIINDINLKEKELTFDNISLNDNETYSIFKQANTLGIFQFESNGIKQFLSKLKPDNLEDLFSAIALYRPGPISNIDSYIKRKQGKEKIDYIDSRLEDILKPTYGILIYQEQIMQVANVMAGYSLGEADILRRAMSKKKEAVILKEKDKFIKQSIDRGYKEEVATKVFDFILKFASYGFNRSHSASYAIIAYKMAYLKANYPAYFMKSLLNNIVGSSLTKEYIYDAKANNVNVINPSINFSNLYYEVENNNIRFPFSGIKNIGYNTISIIIEERKKGLFIDIFDFVKRLYSNKINKNIILNLIYSGCFDEFKINRKTMVENIDLIINYGEISKEIGEEFALKPEINISKEFSSKELLEYELDVFGFYLTNHPVTEYKIKEKNLISLQDIENYFDKNVDIIVYVDKIKLIDTKGGDPMCFINCSDEIGSIEAVCFPKTYIKYNNIDNGDILKINGRVEKRFDKLQIIVNKIEKK